MAAYHFHDDFRDPSPLPHRSSCNGRRRRRLTTFAQGSPFDIFQSQRRATESSDQQAAAAAASTFHIHASGDCPPFWVEAPGQRVVAIGDLHGDWTQTLRALRLAGVVEGGEGGGGGGGGGGSWYGRAGNGAGVKRGDDVRWVGGSTVLVQVGDILDRGEDEIALLSLFHHLDKEARREGGAVFLLNGNHETMNVALEFRYVTEGGLAESERFFQFCTDDCGGDWQAAFTSWWRESRSRKTPAADQWSNWNPIALARRKKLRSELFEAGGPLAIQLSRYGVALMVNDTLFAHGGVLPQHVTYGLDRMNCELSHWMRGDILADGRPAAMPFIATRGFNSIVWTRIYSQERFATQEDKLKVGAMLAACLDAIGAKRMVVGHTPQMQGANSECNGLVWRIDVGMSSGLLEAPPQVLEVMGDKVKVLKDQAFVGTEYWND